MRSFLSVTAIFEAATGLVLIAVPSVAVDLLLGTTLDAAPGVTVTRVAGVALLTLGIACWSARTDAESRAAKGLAAAMLVYNFGVIAILVLARTRLDLFGNLFWPAIVAHAALAVWCVASLTKFFLAK